MTDEQERTPKHTPTPWFVAKFDYADRLGILRDVTQKGDEHPSAEPIAYIEMVEGNTGLKIPEAESNADFIVEACNNYENLLRLNEEMVAWIKKLACRCDYHNEIKCDRCSILARAAEVRKERGSDA